MTVTAPRASFNGEQVAFVLLDGTGLSHLVQRLPSVALKLVSG